jgi:AGZA family xanthine/uracil permease-like MFS transporter
LLERLFTLAKRGTNVRTELAAGLTTFMTMAYIIFVNPSVLGNIPALAENGPALAAATCLAAALPCLLMGLWTNTPLALAPGMGLNATVAFGLCLGKGISWQTAMGVIVVEGLIITLLVLTRTREAVMDAIPLPLKQAISVGIGLFIALIGLVNSGLIRMNIATAPLTFGSFQDRGVQVAALGLLLTIVLFALRWRASLLLGIIATTLIALSVGVQKPPALLYQLPAFSTFGRFDLPGALQAGLWSSILAFLMSDFFDTMGTVIGVGQQANLVDQEGRVARLRDILLVDSLAAVWGGVCGASSCTSYIESASGVAVGGRTGLMTVTVGVLFLLSLFLAPLVGIVPPQATAPALILVGFLMFASVREIAFDRMEESLPAFVTILTIPLTYSIAHGIGYGFLTYLIVLLAQRRWRDLNPILIGISLLFTLSFALEGR